MREISEPFGSTQVGSRRCPISRTRCAASALLRWRASDQYRQQYRDRFRAVAGTDLEDSANRRLVIGGFPGRGCDLEYMTGYCGGLRVSETMIAANLSVHLPFMASEAVMMEGVRRGGNRQELHELIRQHSLAAAEELNHGRPNDLLERIVSDLAFRMSREEIEELMRPEDYAGRAAEQVREYLSNEVMPILNSADPPSESDGVDFDADSQLRV